MIALTLNKPPIFKTFKRQKVFINQNNEGYIPDNNINLPINVIDLTSGRQIRTTIANQFIHVIVDIGGKLPLRQRH